MHIHSPAVVGMHSLPALPLAGLAGDLLEVGELHQLNSRLGVLPLNQFAQTGLQDTKYNKK